MLRVGKTTSALCSSSLRGVANKITSERIEPLDEREKTFEDYGVKEHERKLMQDLIKKLNENQKQPQQQPSNDLRQDLESQLLEMRKELVEEINKCKSEVVELKFKIRRLESKN
eukprot:TRINITY_DN1423_c0_g2_i7.p1 TRINITY_DN1423_c0_g2~~TRINITY_DN1423_c0_g2_i7.p1  ORF type:complete len:114 (+),score=24.10 TRINITY_DN1423_c0_g2_i7:758-1099(+)